MNEESPEGLSKATKIIKLKIEENYQLQALERARALVKGNKFDPQNVSLARFEGEILQFEAMTELDVSTQISKKIKSGRVTGPVQVASEHAANAEIAKEYMKLFNEGDTQRKIRDIALKRDDQGFALKNEVFKIPFWHKEFVMFEPCQTCRSTGNVRCQKCFGKGVIVCNRCNGSGMSYCTNCNGAQMVQSPQGKTTCTVCSGRGRISCGQCQQNGTMQCPTCRTRGSTQCPSCQGNAWISHIFVADIEARANFYYPDNELPEKIVAMISEYGAKIKEHADITVSQKEVNAVAVEKEKDATKAEQKETQEILKIPIFYDVILPYSHIEFEINGKSYYMFMFGKKGELSHVSPFLDDLLANGLRKLKDCIEKRGDAAKNLEMACEYRAIRSGLVYAANLPLRRAEKRLNKDFPIGLSKEATEEIISSTHKTLKLISSKPRLQGLLLSCSIMLLAFLGYFLSPVRTMMIAKLKSIIPQIFLDGMILGGAIFIGSLAIQGFANYRVTQTISKIIRSNKIKLPVKLGETGLWNIVSGILLFFVTIEMARQMKMPVPPWYLYFLS